MKLYTECQFKTLAKIKHLVEYDYSLIRFPIKSTQKIEIIDPAYGKFRTTAERHLNGIVNVKRKSSETGRKNARNNEKFINRAISIHGKLYDYSKVNYVNSHTKVLIIDPDYGEFWQTPYAHLNGQNHPIRGKKMASAKRKKTFTDFLKEAQEKHNSFYDYSKAKYVDNGTKILIIDPEYGEFWQTPYEHLRSTHSHPSRKAKEHVDHIIPISILFSRNDIKCYKESWINDRPLFIFLNSDINKKTIPAKENLDKRDLININGNIVTASSVRNNYEIIEYLIKNLLGINPEEIIKSDKDFLKKYFF